MKYDKDFWSALDSLVSNSTIIIDRPKGSIHPKYTDFIYEVDYGYLSDTSSLFLNLEKSRIVRSAKSTATMETRVLLSARGAALA